MFILKMSTYCRRPPNSCIVGRSRVPAVQILNVHVCVADNLYIQRMDALSVDVGPLVLLAHARQRYMCPVDQTEDTGKLLSAFTRLSSTNTNTISLTGDLNTVKRVQIWPGEQRAVLPVVFHRLLSGLAFHELSELMFDDSLCTLLFS